ncbi:MAG: hypothetical protein AAFX55_06135 [Bacteroidota bacterium]
MKKNNLSLWIKLFGWSILCHIILVAISFIEVFIYSIIINPGQEEAVYSEHATKSAPIIAVVFGIILFFYLARILAKKRPEKRLLIALALPFFYVIIDLMILIPMDVDWGNHYLVFILSFGTKLLAAVAGAYAIKALKTQN